MNYPKKKFILLSILLSSSFLFAKAQEELLLYIGITMVKPVDELAKNFEKKHNCKIKILQGGSQDLYESIKMSKVGDIYLPGSIVYRKKHLAEGFLLDGAFVGFNRIALIVPKGNPKNIQPDLNVLTNPNYRVVLGNESSGSVGKATKKVLQNFGNYKSAMLNTLYLASDSRNMTKAITGGEADVILNWYATTFWDENKEKVEALPLSEKYAKKSKLVFNLLKTSKNQTLAKKFMSYATSKDGQKIFQKYGFLNTEDIKNFNKVTF